MPMPARPITEPKSMLKHRNVITAIAHTAPVILTGLMYSTFIGAVKPDPHCLQNLVPSTDSAPHAGQNIGASRFELQLTGNRTRQRKAEVSTLLTPTSP